MLSSSFEHKLNGNDLNGMIYLHSVKIKFLLAAIVLALNMHGQSYYSEHATSTIYRNLEVALRSPSLVFRLDLSGQNLKSIPEGIYELRNLEYLVLDDNSITQANFKSGELLELRYLSIRNNGLNRFKICTSCLDQLEELYLDGNSLATFPEINNDLIDLTTLSLRQNRIMSLPTEMLQFSRLRFLYLDSNPLENAELAFTYSSQLERLTLYNTRLKSIPAQVSFPRLSKLVLSDNPLDLNTLRGSAFPKLAYLDVSYIAMSSAELFLPITRMTSIRYLIAEDNQLTAIPPEIYALKKLREVTFLRNEIVELPEQFYKLKLKLINIEYNPLSDETKNKLKNSFKGAVVNF